MLTFKITKLMNIFQLTILLVGILLVLNLFYINRFVNSHFEPSMLTLDSLLPSKNAER